MPHPLTNPAAAQSGLLGPGIENDPGRPGAGLLQRIGPAAQGLLDTAMIPGEVFRGAAEPNIPNAVALSGLIGGGGLLAPRPANALGVFGGKQRSAVGAPKIMDLGPGSGGGGGMINQRIRLPGGAEGEVVTMISRNLDNRNMVDLNLNFAIRNPSTGQMGTNLIGLSAKEGQKFLTAAFNEARRHIELVRPSTVTFSAADSTLVPLYRKLAKRIAKETGGKAILSKDKSNPFFEVELPNPRVFKARGGGLLDIP